MTIGSTSPPKPLVSPPPDAPKAPWRTPMMSSSRTPSGTAGTEDSLIA